MRTGRCPCGMFQLLALPLLALATGCEEERHVKPSTDQPTASAPAPAPTPPAKSDNNFIVGQRTQDIKSTEGGMPKGAQVASQKITAKDPITLQGNAYVTAIGSIAIGNIKHAMDLYNADTGHYPETHEEFMTKIIKEGGISLPRLPFYQEYRYDPATKELKIWEYPDKKNGPAPQ